jgi:hypothetical protein
MMIVQRFGAWVLAAGSLVVCVGCAQDPGASEGAAEKGVPAEAPAQGGPVRRARAAIDPPAAWTSRTDDAWTVHEAPGGLSVLAYAEIGAGDAVPARLRDAVDAAGASDVRVADERSIVVGPDALPARAASGACRLGAHEAKVQYAVVDVGGGERMMIVQVVAAGAPEDVARAAMGAVASLRRR